MAWTNVRSRLIFTSVACYKGMIFGLSVNGTLATVEIDENKQNPPIARCLVSLPMGEMCGQKLYLSEASDDLLLVCYHPKRMSVYRCDFISWEWKNVESLGGRVLFLDEHSCLSMCSRVCTKNLEADCIYYSDDNFQSWTDIDNFQSWTDINNYICVYNLKSKNWKTFFLGACVFFRYRSPTWLFPSPRLEIFDRNEFAKWVEKGMAPPLIPSLKLYEEVMKLGFKVFLLTGRSEDHKDITVENLINAGFKDWDKLILRASEDHGKSATLFKSEKRTEMVIDGYRILGNSGDQWSDLLGYSMSVRSFKLPNPMYYIP